jgi:hypothetical protein
METFMLKMERVIPGLQIGQIHDSIVLRIDEREASKKNLDDISHTALEQLTESLPETVYNLTSPRIPLKLDLDLFVPTKETA